MEKEVVVEKEVPKIVEVEKYITKEVPKVVEVPVDRIVVQVCMRLTIAPKTRMGSLTRVCPSTFRAAEDPYPTAPEIDVLPVFAG